MLQKILGDSSADRRSFFLVFGLIFNVFTWFFFLTSVITEIIDNYEMTGAPVIWGALYLSIVTFSIIGAVVSKQVNRIKFLKHWILFGAIASLLPAMINDFTVTNLAVVSVILGASFGLGMPSCLAFFTEATRVDNRGRVAAITFLLASLVGPLLTVTFDYLSFSIIFIICAVWRGSGLLVHGIKSNKQEDSPEIPETSFVSILRSRPFLLYFGAWTMFCLVDAMETQIVTNALGVRLYETMEIIEPIFASVFILVAGFMCDWIGRKKIVLSGFVSLGAAYAIIAFLNGLGDVIWYPYFVVDGAAWGIFYITFVFILWGDLSQHAHKEKYYALGSVPFFLSYIIPYFVNLPSADLTTAFSVAAFFLFLAVLPLISAPETLPEKKMELRRLRSFAEEAQKTKEKYERKLK